MSSRYLNISTDESFTQSVPVRDFLKTERMLSATGFRPLLVNLESMIVKAKAGGDRKNCVVWKFENIVSTNKVTMDSSTD